MIIEIKKEEFNLICKKARTESCEKLVQYFEEGKNFIYINDDIAYSFLEALNMLPRTSTIDQIRLAAVLCNSQNDVGFVFEQLFYTDHLYSNALDLFWEYLLSITDCSIVSIKKDTTIFKLTHDHQNFYFCGGRDFKVFTQLKFDRAVKTFKAAPTINIVSFDAINFNHETFSYEAILHDQPALPIGKLKKDNRVSLLSRRHVLNLYNEARDAE